MLSFVTLMQSNEIVRKLTDLIKLSRAISSVSWIKITEVSGTV
jgi:hypothetical protein